MLRPGSSRDSAGETSLRLDPTTIGGSGGARTIVRNPSCHAIDEGEQERHLLFIRKESGSTFLRTSTISWTLSVVNVIYSFLSYLCVTFFILLFYHCCAGTLPSLVLDSAECGCGCRMRGGTQHTSQPRVTKREQSSVDHLVDRLGLLERRQITRKHY